MTRSFAGEIIAFTFALVFIIMTALFTASAGERSYWNSAFLLL